METIGLVALFIGSFFVVGAALSLFLWIKDERGE